MWRIRDRVEHLNADGIERAFDVSVPLSHMDGYVRGALDRLAAIPGCRAVVYGHIGDNNLHWNTTRLDAAGNAAIDAAIYEPLAALNGSVSAEHGIGLEKRGKLTAVALSGGDRRDAAGQTGAGSAQPAESGQDLLS